MIDSVVDGEQDMSTYGILEEDFKSIYDYIVVERDQLVHNDPTQFKVIDGRLKMRPQEIPERYQ